MSAADTPLGADAVEALAAHGASTESIELTAGARIGRIVASGRYVVWAQPRTLSTGRFALTITVVPEPG